MMRSMRGREAKINIVPFHSKTAATRSLPIERGSRWRAQLAYSKPMNGKGREMNHGTTHPDEDRRRDTCFGAPAALKN